MFCITVTIILTASSFTNQIFFVEENYQRNETDRNLGPYQDYFHTSKENAVIDVWWLYDDGGLTVLVPYILSLRSRWKNCKIRVFALYNHKMESRSDEKSIANLLTKLRITYSSLTIVSDVTRPPQQHTVDFHKSLLTQHREAANSKCFVSNIELIALEATTNRQLRLRESLLEHSKESALVVMSLPIPRENEVSAPLYMSWLDVLTKDMPPFLLIRGNQSSVLTFYA